MPFLKCIDAAVAGHLIDEDRADEYRATFAATEAEMRTRMGPMEAAAQAARDTFAALEGEVAERRRQTFLSLATIDSIKHRLDGFTSYWNGRNDPFLGATGLYDRLLPRRNGLAVEQQIQFWRGQAHGEMDAAFRAYRRDLAGRQGRRADSDNIVREAHGMASGDEEARHIAMGWKRAAEKLRQAFNRFGGHIGVLEDWGLPHLHNQRAIAAVPFPEWRDSFVADLNRARMVDGRTGKPLSNVKLTNALHDMYQAIVTDGWAGKEATSGGGARSLANRHAEHRFLHFNDADGWLRYQRRWGTGSPFDAMMHHVEAMSRDIGLMQVMGPNPSSSLRWVKNELTRRAALSKNPYTLAVRLPRAKYLLDGMHETATGAANIPVHGYMAAGIEDIRNIQTAAFLGQAAMIAMPTDLNFSRMTARFNGVPMTKAMGAYLRMLNPLDPADRLIAARLGLTAQGAADVIGRQARFIGEVHGHEWTRWAADRTLTYSGLTPHTEAIRAADGWAFQSTMAANAHLEWNALDKDFRAAMARYGIGEDTWNAVRTTTPYEDRGVKFIRPADIAARPDLEQGHALDLASRVADWTMTETEFGVPSVSLLGKAIAKAGTRPGSVGGTIFQSVFMFKNFALTYLLSHGRRIVAQTNMANRVKYAASLFVANTILGAFVVQLREIANGRDPRDMKDPKFWETAAVTGGGLGILGDFVYTGITGASKQGRTIGEMLGGPIAGLAGDTFRLLFGGPFEGGPDAQSGRMKEGIAGRAIDFTKRYMPGGSIWYLHAALEHEVWDRLSQEADPGWPQRIGRITRWYKTQFNQDYWWPRDSSPGGGAMRAPDMGAIEGGSQ